MREIPGLMLSSFEGKEIINMVDGAKLGTIGEADIIIDMTTGEIQSIILPRRNSLMSLWMDRQQLIIPWHSIRRIGNEVIIVELDHTVPNLTKYHG